MPARPDPLRTGGGKVPTGDSAQPVRPPAGGSTPPRPQGGVMKFRIVRVWREVEARTHGEAIEATAAGGLGPDELHIRPAELESRDPHSFAPGDPDVVMPRKLAAELLERMEMSRDSVEYSTGKRDDWARRIITRLTSLLEDPDA